MTKYEKECEALVIVKNAAKDGRLESQANDGSWHKTCGVMLDDPQTPHRIKPEPKKVPLELKDWAGGPWWVKCCDNDDWIGITHIAQRWLVDADGDNWTFEELSTCEDWQRTKDFVNIEPCYKTE